MKKKLATTALLLLTTVSSHATKIETLLQAGTNFSLEPHNFFEKKFPQKKYVIKMGYIKNPLYMPEDFGRDPTFITSQALLPSMEFNFIRYDEKTHVYDAELILNPVIHLYKTSELDGNKGKDVPANVVFASTKKNIMPIHGVMVKATNNSRILKGNAYFYVDYTTLNHIGVIVLHDIPITIETT